MLYLNLFLSFTKIGFLSFGGMTMIPIINEEVLKFGWMTSEEVMDIVAIAEMTPGSLGINCATFVGLRSGGIPGALCATLGTMMPSLTLCLAAAHFINKFKDNRTLNTLLKGIRPVCLGMLLAIAMTMGRSVFWEHSAVCWNLIIISLITGYCLFKIKLSIPRAILLAALLGLLIG
ncbi:MAG: chromate transporter [Clostridium sp.]|nr:chromate transporter [Clostridium sp.]